MNEQSERIVIAGRAELDFLHLYAYFFAAISECSQCSEYNEVKNRPLVILCIGSDRYTGDALGPLVGSDLESEGIVRVLGTLEHPIHAGILCETIAKMQEDEKHPFVIVVDACLGSPAEVGQIEAWRGGLQAGLAVGRDLPTFGDLSVVGIVNTFGGDSLRALRETPLATVVRLGKTISRALNLLIYKYNCEQSICK